MTENKTNKETWKLRAFIANASEDILKEMFETSDLGTIFSFTQDHIKECYDKYCEAHKESEVKDGILVIDDKKLGVVLNAKNKLILWEDKNITHYDEDPTLVRTSKGKPESVFYKGKNPYVERVRKAINAYNEMFKVITYVDQVAAYGKD